MRGDIDPDGPGPRRNAIPPGSGSGTRAFPGSQIVQGTAMGLAAFVFFVVPWMAAAAWLSLRPESARLGDPATPWRPLGDFPPPRRDQRTAGDTQRTAPDAVHDDKHQPMQFE